MRIPGDTLKGQYTLQIGILDDRISKPRVNLAIEGRLPDGWYNLGKIDIE
jgi:hypothetical protein